MINRHEKPLHRKCRLWDYKKSHAVVVLYIPNNKKLPGPHAGLGFDIAGVKTFSGGGETTVEFSRPQWDTFCVMANRTFNERLLHSIDDHVVNSRRANLKESLSEGHTFLTVFWERSAEVWQGSILLPYSVFQDFRCLWNKPLDKLRLAPKHVAWFVSGFPWQAKVWDGNSAVWVGKACGRGRANFSNFCGYGAGLNFAGAGRERTKNFNPRRTLLHTSISQ